MSLIMVKPVVGNSLKLAILMIQRGEDIVTIDLPRVDDRYIPSHPLMEALFRSLCIWLISSG